MMINVLRNEEGEIIGIMGNCFDEIETITYLLDEVYTLYD
jgi:hypothetical protein